MHLDSSFIQAELGRALTVKVQGDNALICCPFHDDRSPSLSVLLTEKRRNGRTYSPGTYHCWSCHAKGTWNRLASRLGLTTVNGGGDDYLSDYKPAVKRLQEKVIFDQSSMKLEEVTKKWRKYSPELLQTLGVQTQYMTSYDADFLIFPHYYVGDYIGYARLKVLKSTEGPKSWFNLKRKVFYPYDVIMKHSSRVVVLVEGIPDFLRLYKHRIPALATLGTGWPREIGAEYLGALGIETIVFLYDGDEAGQSAVNGYYDENNVKVSGHKAVLRNMGFKVINYKLKDGLDPDNMPFELVLKLRQKFLDLGGKLLPPWKFK